MIESLSVENFRSIKNLDIDLTKLTVLIGANGTGKSNLVKLIEFIGDIPRSGITMAINKNGGSEWMVPKTIPKKEVKKTNCKIKIKTTFKPPKEVSKNTCDKVSVDYSLSINFKKGIFPVLNYEKIEFNDALLVSKLLSSENDVDSEEEIQDISQSKVTFEKERLKTVEKDKLSLNFSPLPDDTNKSLYLNWFGFPEDLEINTSKFGDNLINTWGRKEMKIRGSGNETNTFSILDKNVTSVLDFAPQYNRFRRELMNISRFDLLLNELRREQTLSDIEVLSTDGTNMPSAINSVKRDKESWERLINTFSAIAPHIVDFDSSPLERNKRFIQFTESKLGRSIESWEASDGSLRALAVLLAIETAKTGTTVIIEEPEQNLHPWAVKVLMDYITEMIEVKSLQVIITTHSQQVVESAKTEDILIASRSITDGTTFSRPSERYPNHTSIELGELWVKGLLGGVPSYD